MTLVVKMPDNEAKYLVQTQKSHSIGFEHLFQVYFQFSNIVQIPNGKFLINEIIITVIIPTLHMLESILGRHALFKKQR